ncbi:MAG: cellulase family glycosylhydrolase [Endomicrobia bacterium]|nr:cellulase family glycosylhydrolase [Endomicrobiia bacterium]
MKKLKTLYRLYLLIFLMFTSSIFSSYLKVIGNKLYDENNNEVRLTGVNWFGFETGNYVAHGLWSRDYKSVLMQIRDLGFNCIRIPWSNEMLNKTPTSVQVNAYGNDAYAAQKGIKLYEEAPQGFTGINLDLQGLSSLEILDKIIEEAGKLGLKVILDNHSRKADGYMNETLWYTQECSEEKWISDWVFLANRYKNNPTVIAADLNNEPHGNTGMGMKPPASWGYNVPGYGDTDWAAAAEKCGNAILQVNPNWLIIVEGVEQYQNDYYWWGGNLMGVANRPINLIYPEKLVYSPHEYGPEVHNQSWFSAPDFPNNMPQIWYNHFGFIHDLNIGHLLVGEFGIKNKSNSVAYTWFTEFMKYMGDKYSWTFWCMNPNSGDTGGILQDDWVTVHEWKMEVLRPYLAPLITSSTSQQQIDTPPIVNISTPTNNSNLSGNVLISVLAADDKGIAKIELYIDNNKISSTTTNTLQYNLNTSNYQNGTYTLKAVAYDTKNQFTQKEIIININNTSTSSQFTTHIKIVSPLNNQTLSGQTTIFIQTSTDIIKVEFYLDNTLLLDKQDHPYICLLNTNDYSNGVHTLKVVGFNISTYVVNQIDININNILGDAPPTLSIDLTNNVFSNRLSFHFIASDDNLLKKAEIYISNIKISSFSINSKNFNQQLEFNTNIFQNGNYVLNIIVYDSQNQTANYSTNITIDKSISDDVIKNFQKTYFLSINNDGINDIIVFPEIGVEIMDLKGNIIKSLNTYQWDGKTDNNMYINNGIYIYSYKPKKIRGKIIIVK